MNVLARESVKNSGKQVPLYENLGKQQSWDGLSYQICHGILSERKRFFAYISLSSQCKQPFNKYPPVPKFAARRSRRPNSRPSPVYADRSQKRRFPFIIRAIKQHTQEASFSPLQSWTSRFGGGNGSDTFAGTLAESGGGESSTPFLVQVMVDPTGSNVCRHFELTSYSGRPQSTIRSSTRGVH